jgi:bifunctional UDP-N-acetylglucosamine pyrophosphorylase/glucosamine-1-phosphate N-acetyltransferase
MASPAGALGDWLAGCAATTRSGEYYLTDIVALAVADGVRGARRRPRRAVRGRSASTASAQLAELGAHLASARERRPTAGRRRDAGRPGPHRRARHA